LSNLTFASVYVIVYVAAALPLRGHPLAESVYSDIALLLPALAVCVLIARRRREWLGAQRLFWDAFLLGMLVWSGGHVIWGVSTLVFHRSAWEAWHTLFSLSAAAGPIVAMLTLPHLGRRESATSGIAVLLVGYGILGGFVYAYFVLVPAVVSMTGRVEAAMVALMQAQRIVVVGGLGWLAWIGRRSDWRVTYRDLFAGAAAGLLLRIVSGISTPAAAFHVNVAFELSWIVPFLSYAIAASHAPGTQSDARPSAEGSPSPLLLVVPVLLIPAIGYGLVDLSPLGDPGDSFRMLLTTLTTVAGFGVLTLRFSAQSSELQRADARLRLLAAAVEQTDDLILITDAGGKIVQANAKAVQALGYSRAELRGMLLSEIIEHGFEDTLDRIGAAVRRSGVWRGTLVHRRRDGGTFPAANTVVALRSPEGSVTHFVGVGRDITQELQLREQLVNTERLSAIGELVAGVAHELNNPLQTVIGSVELLLDGDGGDIRKDLELVRQEATRAGQIVRNLLAFVRRSTPDRRPDDLNQIARATAAVREHHLAQQNIALELHLDPRAVVALVKREEIQQIVLNLVLNAEHAIGDAPGAIRIRTEAGPSMHTLTVTDSGPGVKPELRGRIFEPFFTTKDVGEGTGLGLSISMGIATAHGGTLELCNDTGEAAPKLAGDSEPAKAGACFKLTLPAYSVAAQAGTPAHAVASAFKLKT
jgi:PAS domain S-box-containing protein